MRVVAGGWRSFKSQHLLFANTHHWPTLTTGQHHPLTRVKGEAARWRDGEMGRRGEERAKVRGDEGERRGEGGVKERKRGVKARHKKHQKRITVCTIHRTHTPGGTAPEN